MSCVVTRMAPFWIASVAGRDAGSKQHNEFKSYADV